MSEKKSKLRNMLGYGLRFKATAFIVVIIIVVAAILSGYFITHQRNQAYSDLMRRGVSLVKNLAYISEYGVLIASEDELNSYIEALDEEEDFVYVIIQDEGGEIIASTDTEYEDYIISHLRHSTPDQLEEEGLAEVHTLDTERWGSVFDVSYPILTVAGGSDFEGDEVRTDDREGTVIGTARIGVTHSNVQRLVMRNSMVIVSITLLIIILAGVFTNISVGKLFMGTLNQLVEAAEAIGQGKIKGSVEVEVTDDEFGQLAHAFKKMQSQLSVMAEQAKALADDDLKNDILDKKIQGELGEAFFTMVNNLRGFADIAELISQDSMYDEKINDFVKENNAGNGSRGNLGGAFYEMVQKLRNLASQADLIAEGDLTNEALAEEGSGTLGGAFASMVRSLRKLSEQADAIAAGNLRAPVLKEEIEGDLGNAFNKMADTLRKLIGSFKEMSHHVGKSANDTLESSRKILAGAKKQTEKAEESSSAVIQMTSSIQEVSTNAVNAESKSNQAKESSLKGAKVVKDTVESLDEVTSNVDEVSSRMSELEKGSKEIGNIVNTISEISEQTNLLALNATIEAARSGESGKGFAVVADEVKKLADRSAASAEEIAEIIKSIQKYIGLTMDAMEKNSKSTKKAVEVSGVLDETFQSIQDIVTDTKLSIDEIGKAMKEQEMASENIEVSMNSIKDVIQNSEVASEKMTSQARKLNQITDDLQHMLQEFNV